MTTLTNPDHKIYGKYPKSPREIPTGEHWVIITGSSYRTEASGEWAPGHGYPAETRHYLSYECFTDMEEFKHEVRRLMNDKDSRASYGRDFRALHVLPVTVEVNVDVKV